MINKSFSGKNINRGRFWPGLDNINPWVIFAFFLICVVVIQGTQSPQSFDDAYITFRYARNISNGLGFVYNHGEKVLGTTTPLFTLLLSLIALISQPEFLPRASFLISILADTLNIWLIFRLTNSLFKDRGIAALTSLVFLLQPFRLNVASGGMETSLFITSLLLTYDRYIDGKRSLSTSIWAAVAFLIRPDAVIALIPIYVDWFINDKRVFLRGVLIALLVISPWMIWSTYYYGSPIPHSIIAKSISYKNPPGHAAFFLLTFIGTGTPGPYSSPYILLPIILFGLPVLTIGPRVLLKHQSKAMIMGFYPILYIILMILLNPSMIFSWYYIPLIPGMLILTMGLILYGLEATRKTKLVVASALSLILLLVPAFLLNKQPSSLLSRAREAAFWDVCNFLSDHDLIDKSVLAPDIGVIGWCLEEVNVLDPIGLVSPETLAYSKDLPPGELVSLKLIKDKQPDYIITLDYFITPNILGSNDFKETYELIYESNVSITDANHPLYIFQLCK